VRTKDRRYFSLDGKVDTPLARILRSPPPKESSVRKHKSRTTKRCEKREIGGAMGKILRDEFGKDETHISTRSGASLLIGRVWGGGEESKVMRGKNE